MHSCHRGLLIQHIFLQLCTPLQLKLIDFFRCLSLLSFTAVRTALDTLKVGESPLILSNLRVCKTTPEECLNSSRLHLEHRLARVNAQVVVFGLQVAMCQIHMRWQLNLGNDFNGVWLAGLEIGGFWVEQRFEANEGVCVTTDRLHVVLIFYQLEAFGLQGVGDGELGLQACGFLLRSFYRLILILDLLVAFLHRTIILIRILGLFLGLMMGLSLIFFHGGLAVTIELVIVWRLLFTLVNS